MFMHMLKWIYVCVIAYMNVYLYMFVFSGMHVLCVEAKNINAIRANVSY